jgi:hypothetical protein
VAPGEDAPILNVRQSQFLVTGGSLSIEGISITGAPDANSPALKVDGSQRVSEFRLMRTIGSGGCQH